MFLLKVSAQHNLHCTIQLQYCYNVKNNLLTIICLFMCRLQLENDKLIGRHNAHAQQLQDEVIDLPDKVEVKVFIFIQYC